MTGSPRGRKTREWNDPAQAPRGAVKPPDPLAATTRLAVLRRMEAENPRGRWFLALGSALRESGHSREGLEVVRRGLARDPECLSGWVVLGQCYLALDELSAARRVFSAALRRDGENTVALRGLAIIHARRGEREEAAGYYRSLLKLLPRDLAAQEALAALLEPDLAADGSPSTSGAQPPDPQQLAPESKASARRAKRRSRFDPRVRRTEPPPVRAGARTWLAPEPGPREGLFAPAPFDLDWDRSPRVPSGAGGAAARRPHSERGSASPRSRTRADAGRAARVQVQGSAPAPGPRAGRAGALSGYRRWLERMLSERGETCETGGGEPERRRSPAVDDPGPPAGGPGDDWGR